MRRILFLVKHYLELRYDALRLWVAIKIANAKQKAYNKRYFVLSDTRGQLQVLNSSELKELRKPRRVTKVVDGKKITRKVYLMNPKATHLDWMRECLYYTPLSLNNKAMSEEERLSRKESWLLQMESIRFAYSMKRRKNAKKEKPTRKG